MTQQLMVGSKGMKSLWSLGDFDAWIDGQVDAKYSGAGEIQKYYQAVPWLFRGTLLRAQAIASFPFSIVRDGGTEIVDSSDDYQNAVEFLPDPQMLLWLIEASLTLTGKSYLRHLFNRIITTELKYYAPTTIKPKYNDATGELLGYIRRANNADVPLTVEDVIAFYYPDPFAEQGAPHHYPASAAQAASGVMFNLDLFAKMFFERGAIKASVISAPGNTQKPERDRLKAWYTSLLTGVKNAFAAEVINADAVTVTTIGEGIKELENTNLSQEKREDIAAALTIPQTMLFSGSAAGLGGGGVTDADDIRFVNEFKIPEFTFIAKILNKAAMIPNGFRIVPNPEKFDALHQDEVVLAQTANEYADLLAKCAEFEEWDALADMTGFEYDEKKFKKVFDLKKKKAEETAAQAMEQARVLRQAALNQTEPEPANMSVSKPPPAQITAGKAIGGYVLAENSSILDEYTVPTSFLKKMGIDPDIESAKSVERKQYERFKSKASNAGKAFTFHYLDEAEQETLMGVKKNSVGVKSIGGVSQRFQAELTALVNDAWLNQGGKITRDMNALVSQYVEDAFDEGLLDAGSTPEQMTDADRALVDELEIDQRQYIAKFATDVQDAEGDMAQQESIRRRVGLWAESMFSIGQRGWAVGKSKTKRRIIWNTANDDLTCPICAPLNGKIVDAGKPFAVGIYNEPAHPNCRCQTVEYVEASDYQ